MLARYNLNRKLQIFARTDAETTLDLENKTRTFKWSARQENTTLRMKLQLNPKTQ